jgi:hypothetical protein
MQRLNKSCRRVCGRVIPAVFVALVLAGVASACPTCSDGLAGADPHHQSIAAGFYYSILFMMSMPYLILGTFSYLAYRSIQRARGRNAAAGDVSGD